MSFDLVCGNCGAASGPSIGVCPFCKSIMVRAESGKKGAKPENPVLARLKKYYQVGDVSQALVQAKALVDHNPKMTENPSFALIYAKVLLETEAPSSQIKNVLSHAYIADPDNIEVTEYLDIIEAKTELTHEPDDSGEQKLVKILRRSPENPHALFLLGAHLFWTQGERITAIRHLEKCVKVHPNFLRAWGCLGAIYEKMGNIALASRAFRKCIGLENEPSMKAFFKEKEAALKEAGKG